MLSTKPSKTSQGYDHIFWVIVDRLHLSSANLPPMRETDPLDNTCTDAVLKDGVTTAWEYLSLNIRVDRDRDSHQILEVTSEALGTKFGYEVGLTIFAIGRSSHINNSYHASIKAATIRRHFLVKSVVHLFVGLKVGEAKYRFRIIQETTEKIIRSIAKDVKASMMNRKSYA
ncbi:hypothetical protein Tco_0139227 [Tanacetum coccineum]